MNKPEPTRQELLEFVKPEVIMCQSSLVDMLLGKEIDGIGYDEIVNLEKTEQELLDEGYTQEQIDNGDAQPDKEIYEWWSCSGWLLDKLQERGEPILRTDYGDWWGRCCTGQAIALDRVIADIYKELHQ